MDLTRALASCGIGEIETITPMAGGYHNSVYDVTATSGRFVAKHFVAVSTNPLFPQLPRSEMAALVLLMGRDVAPSPVALLDDVDGRALLVYAMVHGSPWRDGTSAIGHLLQRVHETPLDARATADSVAELRSLPATPNDVLAHSRDIAGRGTARERLERQLARPAPAPQRHRNALVHTDCGPGNVIVGPDDNGMYRPVLIDWQCPGIGDPVEDLANFVSPAIQILYGCPPLEPQQVDALLDAYTDGDVVERFHRIRRPYHVRLAAYCAMRSDELRATEPEVGARYDRALDAELDLVEQLP